MKNIVEFINEQAKKERVMQNLSITLADGTFNGAVTMQSSSKFHVVRTAKSLVSNYSQDLEEPGLYFLLVGNNSIYVGQSGLDNVGRRIMNTHSGNIDSQWHTVVGFMCSERTITANELLYMENALCEFVHGSHFECLTSSPSRNNCNANYRRTHYHLSGNRINACNQYIEDIKHYISLIEDYLFVCANISDFPSEPVNHSSSIRFYCSGPRGAKAEGVFTRPGLKVRKGSTIARDVSPSFLRHNYNSHRTKLIEEGIILDYKFVDDYQFSSPSEAAAVVLGRSAAGTTEWKTIDGKPLKDFLH